MLGRTLFLSAGLFTIALTTSGLFGVEGAPPVFDPFQTAEAACDPGCLNCQDPRFDIPACSKLRVTIDTVEDLCTLCGHDHDD